MRQYNCVPQLGPRHKEGILKGRNERAVHLAIPCDRQASLGNVCMGRLLARCKGRHHLSHPPLILRSISEAVASHTRDCNLNVVHKLRANGSRHLCVQCWADKPPG